MSDEKGTEATRSDTPDADENLFGDAAEEPSAAVPEDADAKEQDTKDANGEAEQDREEPEDGEDKAGDAETGAQADLKVVVSIKEDRATIGVQQPSSDPHIESFDYLDEAGLTTEIPGVVKRARARWEDAPKYPGPREARTSGQAPLPASAGVGGPGSRR